MGFLMYPQDNGQPQQQLTPEQRRQQIQQQFAQQILGQQASTPEGGMGQLAAGLAMWRQRQQQQPQNQFPQAPGGGPSMMQGIGSSIGNFFTGNSNGGLY